LLRRLVEVQYTRNDVAFSRGTFRVRGDTVEIIPAYEENAIRIEFFGDEIERLMTLHPLTGEVLTEDEELYVLPASHYVAGAGADGAGDPRDRGGAGAAARRSGAAGQAAGGAAAADTHDLDFPEDFLLVIDESHVTVPQIGGMYEGDMSRKRTLVDHGFRLPSAMDNRPLRWEEFQQRIGQTVYLSATPGPYELSRADGVVEQIIWPTGRVDPEVVVKPTRGQIDEFDVLVGINCCARASTCPRCRWCRSWTRTRRGSCGRAPR